jgi:hypothetical protein
MTSLAFDSDNICANPNCFRRDWGVCKSEAYLNTLAIPMTMILQPNLVQKPKIFLRVINFDCHIISGLVAEKVRIMKQRLLLANPSVVA